MNVFSFFPPTFKFPNSSFLTRAKTSEKWAPGKMVQRKILTLERAWVQISCHLWEGSLTKEWGACSQEEGWVRKGRKRTAARV